MTKEEAYQICREKVYLHMSRMPKELSDLPENREGEYYRGETDPAKLSHRYCWTASFVSGMAVLLAHTDGDMKALRWTNQFAGQYHDKVFQDYSPTMHDLGFLLAERDAGQGLRQYSRV